MKKLRYLFSIVALASLTVATLANPPVAHATSACLVNRLAPGPTHDGSTWAYAYTDLNTALNSASCWQIWVARGIYKPGTLQTDTFNIVSGKAVYGGFAGTETSLGDRNPRLNLTVLSGDVDNNDVVDPNGITQYTSYINLNNSYHVVTMDGTSTGITATTVLDGFTITGGKAVGASWLQNYGGGLLCSGYVTGAVCSPTLNNLAFIGNYADYGGGIMNEGAGGGNSNPTISNSLFSNNTAGTSGGAILNGGNIGGNSSPTITNVTFHNNVSSIGGAITNEGSDTGSNSSPILTNVTFVGNNASNGHAMFSNGTNGSSHPVLSNVILWENGTYPELANTEAVPTIDYSVVEYDCSSLTGSSCGTHNTSADPKLAPLANYGGYTDTQALLTGSSAIDAGTNSGCPSTDQRGMARPVDGDTNGFLTCDIGAYELQSNTIDVNLGSYLMGIYPGTANQGEQHSYGGWNTGPARVTNSTLGSVVSSIRVLYGGTSYSEMMGYPSNTTMQFWFPWYNDVAMDSQVRVSNLSDTSTPIIVYLGASVIDTFTLAANAAVRKNYAGQNGGPLRVVSTMQPILATVRVLYGGGSFSEMMGFPNNTTTQFWFPWYNDVAMDSQFRVSNIGGTSTTVSVYLGGVLLDSFILNAGQAKRKNYAGYNAGPLYVTSSGGVPILATVRVLYGTSSYSELMGYPNNTTTDFWFPWYDDVGTDSQVRVSNVGVGTTTVSVYLNGVLIDSYSLLAGRAVRKNYATYNNGGLHIQSSGGVPILATVRVLYNSNSFYEVMGESGNNWLRGQYFPWYNDVAMDSQLRFAVVGP